MGTPTQTPIRIAALAAFLTCGSCNLNLSLPEERSFRSDSDQVVGALRWEIVDCASNTVLSRGARELRARDVAILQLTENDGSVTFDKRVDLEHGFYFEMAEFPETARDQVDGFGIMAGRDGSAGFSWEWFDATDDSHAVKRQESGELVYAPVAIGGRWEVGRTEFASDVSLRIYDRGAFDVWREKPAWRIRLERGSYIDWPYVADGEVGLPSVPGPAPRPN